MLILPSCYDGGQELDIQLIVTGGQRLVVDLMPTAQVETIN